MSYGAFVAQKSHILEFHRLKTPDAGICRGWFARKNPVGLQKSKSYMETVAKMSRLRKTIFMRCAYTFSTILFLLLAALAFSCKYEQPPARILVFSKTEGFRHESISAGLAALQDLGAANSFVVEHTENAADFQAKNLCRYAAVVFLNTSGDVLDSAQQTAFEQYIRSGGGFVGIHAASDTEYDWPWYGGLVGAYFNGHPAIQDATLLVSNSNHSATRHLASPWQRRDEWYNFRNRHPQVSVLVTIDENTYSGGTMGADHPISWHHEYDGGLSFYTAMGHTPETFAEPNFLKHLLGGLQYAMDGWQGRSCSE